MSNNTKENSNNTFNSDSSPFPKEYHNEVQHMIESFSKCFMDRYNACPTFFMGSLQDACKTAFNSTIIKEHRPILIYIHHDKSSLSNDFCSNIFCSKQMIEYLSKNYIVWPWDITYESHRNRLMKVWKQLFPIPLLNMYFIKRCPMLIGIMQQPPDENYWSITSNYEFKILLEADNLVQIKKKLNYEDLLKELTIFKQECDENERALSFDFVKKTGLCWDIILHITQYLSINDAITAFSPEILPLLLKSNSKIYLSDPSNTFIKKILPTINSKPNVSLRLKPIHYCPMIDLSTLTNLTDVISLTLINFRRIEKINEYEQYFSKLNNLYLWYDNDEIDFDLISNIVCRLSKPIKQLKIRCVNVSFNRSTNREPEKKNTSIEYFNLDITQFFLTNMSKCTYRFLEILINFIKCMQNIGYVHLLTNKHNLDELLNEHKWVELITKCNKLKKIIFQMDRSMIPDEQLTQKILKFKNELDKTQNSDKFKIIL